MYSCHGCDYKAKRISQLRQPKKSKHDGVTYACDECDYKDIQYCHIPLKLVVPIDDSINEYEWLEICKVKKVQNFFCPKCAEKPKKTTCLFVFFPLRGGGSDP